ncbi:MAG: DinB family protein [Saprospiraceae bacterium]|nr:DinB family protein [Saprospiraceae bacterium]
MLRKPLPSDIPSFQQKYIENTPVDILSFLAAQLTSFPEFINGLTEAQLNYRYAPEKWTLREVLMHIIDTEQIFNYRALAILRGDKATLPGFDQDEYIAFTSFDHYSKQDMVELFQSVRRYAITFFNNTHNDEWDLIGNISDYTMPLHAFPYMIGGHLAYHMEIIKERYLVEK